MTKQSRTLILLLVATVVLHQAFAFVRVGRSEVKSSSEKLSRYLADSEAEGEEIRSASASIKARIQHQLRLMKRLIDNEGNGDSELYLFVAKSHRRMNDERLGN